MSGTSTGRTVSLSSQQAPWFQTFRWPVAEPGATLDYGLNISAALNDVSQDSIVLATLSVGPSGEGELQPSDLNVQGSLVSFWLSDGVAGRLYTIIITATSTFGRTWEWVGMVQMDTTLAYPPILPPPDPGFSTPIVWPESNGGGYLFNRSANSAFLIL